jgi:hypothetical protein
MRKSFTRGLAVNRNANLSCNQSVEESDAEDLDGDQARSSSVTAMDYSFSD